MALASREVAHSIKSPAGDLRGFIVASGSDRGAGYPDSVTRTRCFSVKVAGKEPAGIIPPQERVDPDRLLPLEMLANDRIREVQVVLLPERATGLAPSPSALHGRNVARLSSVGVHPSDWIYVIPALKEGPKKSNFLLD